MRMRWIDINDIDLRVGITWTASVNGWTHDGMEHGMQDVQHIYEVVQCLQLFCGAKCTQQYLYPEERLGAAVFCAEDQIESAGSDGHKSHNWLDGHLQR